MTQGGTPRARLPSQARLHQSREFQRVYKHGMRATGAWLTAVVLRQNVPKGVRLGVSVSKDNGSAVRRNKIKRLLREAFRLERHALPPDIDVVLIPRPNDAHATLPELRAEVARLCQQALEKRQRNSQRRRSREGDAKREGGEAR